MAENAVERQDQDNAKEDQEEVLRVHLEAANERLGTWSLDADVSAFSSDFILGKSCILLIASFRGRLWDSDGSLLEVHRKGFGISGLGVDHDVLEGN